MENNERQIMSEEERRFKVKKIEKYEEMVDRTEKTNVLLTIGLGFCVLCFIFDMLMAYKSYNDNHLIYLAIDMIIALSTSVVTSKFVLHNLLCNIANKISLQTNLNMLKDELELDDEFQKTKRK